MKQQLKTFIVALALLSLPSLAQQLRLGQPSYGGNGCPAGTASVMVSPSGQELSILFDQFIAESGRDVGRNFDRKSCNLTVPVHVPNGYSVGIFQVDYRGFNRLPWGARARFDAEYFWAGSRGPRVTRHFQGPLNQDFFVRDELAAKTVVWAPCGQSVNLRVNASISNETNRWGEQAFTAIDSTDISAEIIYHLRWRRCF